MTRLVVLLLAVVVGCRGGSNEESDLAPAEHSDDHTASAAEQSMVGVVSANEDLHLRLTALRPMTAGDSARAAEVLAVMRRDLVRYRDIGAMFTAPAELSEDELHQRLPLSVARWHQHINWCLPPLADARRRWRETRDGQPVFGPKSPIATVEACEAVGGRFRERLFGWMVHVMAFGGDDPWQTHHE